MLGEQSKIDNICGAKCGSKICAPRIFARFVRPEMDSLTTHTHTTRNDSWCALALHNIRGASNKTHFELEQKWKNNSQVISLLVSLLADAKKWMHIFIRKTVALYFARAHHRMFLCGPISMVFFTRCKHIHTHIIREWCTCMYANALERNIIYWLRAKTGAMFMPNPCPATYKRSDRHTCAGKRAQSAWQSSLGNLRAYAVVRPFNCLISSRLCRGFGKHLHGKDLLAEIKSSTVSSTNENSVGYTHPTLASI